MCCLRPTLRKLKYKQSTILEWSKNMEEDKIFLIICYLHRDNMGKAIPVQAWVGPKFSRRLKLPDFKTVGK